MIHKHTLTIAAVMLTSILFAGCKKDSVTCSNSQEFCGYVNDQDFEATGPLIDEFLAGLDQSLPDENLKCLRDWLQCMDCVNKAVIICNSCIETYPAQSEIRIDFISNGQSMPLTLDILMDESMRFQGYHP